jgi:hypothetical protein
VFEPQWLLGIYLWRSPRGQTTLRFAFTGTIRDFDPNRRLDPPIITTHWLTRPELLARSERLRSELVLRCIDDYLGGTRLPLAAIAAFSGAGTMAPWQPPPPSA